VLLAHDDVDLSPKDPVQVGELAVAVTVGMVLAVLEPEKLQVTPFRRSSSGHTSSPEWAGRCPTAPLRNSNCSSRGRRARRGAPGQARRHSTHDVVGHGGDGNAERGTHLAAAELFTKAQPEYISILRMATRGLVNCCSSDGLSEEPAEQGLPRASC